MRKFIIFGIIGVALLATGFTGKLPAPVEGVYSLKPKTLTIFDLSMGEISIYGNTAELTDSKPDFLEVEGIEYEKFSSIKFGNFRLGNNEKKIWFLMTQNSTGYWDSFYIDQNLDYKITKKESVKSFQSTEGRERGYNILRSLSLIPISLKVSYKGITKEYEKNLYFFIQTSLSSKKQEYYIAAVAFSASFLEGEMKLAENKRERLYKFSIIDADSNGCFNDYGKDLLYINLKRDSAFHKKESRKLTEFFDSTGADGVNKQLRFNLLPYSLQLGVTEVTGDFDFVQLEPPVNDEDAKSESEPNFNPNDESEQPPEESDFESE
jgi:hypothetical protein